MSYYQCVNVLIRYIFIIEKRTPLHLTIEEINFAISK